MADMKKKFYFEDTWIMIMIIFSQLVIIMIMIIFSQLVIIYWCDNGVVMEELGHDMDFHVYGMFFFTFFIHFSSFSFIFLSLIYTVNP
jgi:hypothetical protein